MKQLEFLTLSNVYDNLQIGDIILPNEFITKLSIVYKISQQKEYIINFPFRKSFYVYPKQNFGHFFWIDKNELDNFCNWKILK